MTDFQQIVEDCLTKLARGTSTVEECLARYPEYAAQLRPLLRTVVFMNLGRDVEPPLVYKAPTQANLKHTTQARSRLPRSMPVFARLSVAFAMLAAALLITGTARAQSAMPGENLYNWKRTSEEIWRVLSFDPVATDIVLANRRVDEWIAVAGDPARSAEAKDNYFEVLTRLGSTNDVSSLVRILPALQSQQEVLNDAGLVSVELDQYVTDITVSNTVAVIPPAAPTTTRALPTVTASPQPTIQNTPTTEIIPSLEPTSTATTEPTSTATTEPTSTATLEPTQTPEPTQTLEPTQTPQPTQTLEPTQALEPTSTPDVAPTPNSEPTSAPPIQVSPTPSDGTPSPF